jgi:recombination protein RecA
MAQQEQKTDDRQKILEARMKELGISPSKLLRGEQLDSKHKVFVPIGVTEVDIALGDIPGLTAGSVIEFVGESSSGKTYLALKHAAEMHKLGKRVAFLNIENAFYEPRAQALGVLTRDKNLFELYESVGDGETWGELAKSLAKSGDYGLIIIDSVTAMIPQADYDKSLEDEPKIGAHARMTGRLAQKLVSICPETNTSVILINQYRYGQGVIKGTMVKKSTGGESIGFYAHYRLVISKMNGIGGQRPARVTG